MQKVLSKRKIALAIALILAVMLILVGCGNDANKFNEGVNLDEREFKKVNDERKFGEAENYKGYVYKMGDKLMYFRLKTPKVIEDGKNYPLVIFLHGAGDWGDNNIGQMYKSLITSVDKYAKEECYVFMPQTSKESAWTENNFDFRKKGDSDIYNHCLDNYILNDLAVDKTRVYLTGMSMGGNGTLYQLYNFGEKYAAGMALCGWSSYKDLTPLIDMPLWLAHSEDDPSVSAISSWYVNSELLRLGNKNVKSTWYKEEGHQITQIFYDNPEVWDWLFAKKK